MKHGGEKESSEGRKGVPDYWLDMVLLCSKEIERESMLELKVNEKSIGNELHVEGKEIPNGVFEVASVYELRA